MRLTRPALPIGLVAAALLFATVAQAEHTRFWRQSDYQEFEKGTAKGVALRSDGTLVPAPRFDRFADPNVAYLWALRADSRGNLYAAGGSNAKVLRFDAQGHTTTLFESQEMAAQALALDAHDNLYVGTSPDGKVYKITPPGERTVFFDPKTKYIWNLAVDSDGVVYVATGDTGEVFAVTPDGKGQVFYKSDERHIRSLAFDAQGNLLLGTEPSGLVVRVEKSRGQAGNPPKAGRAFVLYETEGKEVTALALDPVGNIYAAAVGEKPRAPQNIPPIVPAMVPTPVTFGMQAQPGTVQTAPTVPAVPVQQPTPFIPFPILTGGSSVYRIAPDGSPKQLWSSREDLVYSLGLSSAGKLLLGTGNRGVVIELQGNEVYSSLAQTASAQVTGLAPGPGGKVYVCTANPGKVFTLGPDTAVEGTLKSEPFDAKIFSRWGRLTWWGEGGATDGKVVFYVRSGNTSNPEQNWSPWAGPYTNANGEAVGCPPARFVQWKAVFQSGSATPSVSWVSVAYLPNNVAPVVDNVIVQSPGIRVQNLVIQQPGLQAAQPVQLRLPPVVQPGQVVGQLVPQQPQAIPKFEPPPQGFVQKAYQSVVWSAHDDNDDDLIYRVYYRGENEKNWKLLKDKLEQKFYSWDTTSMPDGAYYLKIVASDSPSNPPAEALTAERVSDRFEVDNTPPVIQNLRAEAGNPDVRVRFDALDSYSALARAEYSLDAGDWVLVFPVGQLTDSPHESYEIALRDLSPGEHTLSVRVYDRFENSTSAKTTFVVPAAKKR
jgi:hypothetical protein